MVTCSSVCVAIIAPRLRVFIWFAWNLCWSLIFLVCLLSWFFLKVAILQLITFSVLRRSSLSIISAIFAMVRHLFSIVVVVIISISISIMLLLLLLIIVLIVFIFLIIVSLIEFRLLRSEGFLIRGEVLGLRERIWRIEGLEHPNVMRMWTVGGQGTFLHLREFLQVPLQLSTVYHCPVLELELLTVAPYGFENLVFVHNHWLNVIFLFNINNIGSHSNIPLFSWCFYRNDEK